MNNLLKLGGIAALIEAFLYVSAFIFFGAFWDFPYQGGAAQKLAFIAANHVAIELTNLLIYVLFGVLLTVLVLALYQRLKKSAGVLTQVASVFGLIWVGLVIASGMISTIGTRAVIELSMSDPQQAISLWLTITTVAEGIGGGNEIVGGLWVLLISLAALKSNIYSKNLHNLGFFVGLAGIITVYPSDIFAATFGLTQIVWFVWLGWAMIKESSIKKIDLTEGALCQK